VAFTPSAERDLRHFRKIDQKLILDAVQLQLVHEPVTETTNRKRLKPNPLGPWELRIGDFRVFYSPDVEAKTVSVGAVGVKEHNTLYIRGEVFQI
jgi:mRNA-degrading endonuclease RelE of RelBE toxin-antitoxin system